MNAEFQERLQTWFPSLGVRGFDAVVPVSTGDFGKVVEVGAKNIIDTLRVGDILAADPDADWTEYVIAFDDASDHGMAAAVFVKLLLDLAYETAPVQAPTPIEVGVIGPGDHASIARSLATRFLTLKKELATITTRDRFVRWMIEFLSSVGHLLTFSVSICAYKWIDVSNRDHH
jgi:hypothetical protein